MNKEKISVIIPVYNVKPFLEKCITSILNQTYMNLEIILIDNGSTDGSSQICDEIGVTDSRIIVIHQENQGVSEARNTGLQIATGDYIGFVDSDDTVELGMYEAMIKEAIEKEADVVFCNYRLVDENDNVVALNKIKIADDMYDFYDASYYMTVRPGYITAIWNKLFKRSVIYDENGFIPFPKGITVGEDQLWLINVLHKDIKVVTLNQCFYNWLKRTGSASRTQGITKQRMDELTVAEKACQIYRPYGGKLSDAAQVKLYLVARGLLFDKWKSGDHTDYKRLFDDMALGRWKWVLTMEERLFPKCKSMFTDYKIWLYWKVFRQRKK